MTLEVRLIAHGSPDYAEMVTLRRRILRAPLGLDFTPEQLAAERDDLLVGAYEDGQLVGCLLMTPHGERALHMRQVAVDADRQGGGIGRELVRFAEQLALERGYTEIELHARETAVAFYLKLGYEVTGEPYIEVTLPHRTMFKSLRSA
jgi:ribosomal protein S18 acetylase RimI-like enzyme